MEEFKRECDDNLLKEFKEIKEQLVQIQLLMAKNYVCKAECKAWRTSNFVIAVLLSMLALYGVKMGIAQLISI